MNLFESAINSNRQQVGSTYTAPSRETGTSAVSKLSVGQTFSGEIQDISKGTVEIRLDNGQTMQARLQEQYRFNIGEKITFEVKSNSGSLIEIRPVLPSEQGIAPTALKALSAAELPVNDRTLELLKTLMDQQMPIDRVTLTKMYKMVLANGNADPSSIVEMTKLNIPVTKENVAQFENYKNFNHQISAQAELLADELPKLLGELSKEGSINANAFHARLIGMLLPENGNYAVNTEGLDNLQQVVQKNEEGGILNAGDILQETGEQNGEKTVNTQQDAYLNSAMSATEKNLIGTNPGQIKLNEVLDKDMLRELTASLKGISMNDAELSLLAKGDLSVKEFFEAVKSFINNGENLHSLMENRAYHRLIGMQFENNLLLSPVDVSEKQNVEQYYSRLKALTAEAGKLMELVGKESSVAAKTIMGMSDNIEFMNQLNQMFTYVQLPLKLAGESAHGDLYVYTKKKNLLEKEGKITALLHLDMTNLGNMDILVELEKDVVNASFRMENEDSLRFIEKNADLLIERLRNRGYNPTAEFIVRNDTPDFVEDFLEHEQTRHQTPMQRFSFDVKA